MKQRSFVFNFSWDNPMHVWPDGADGWRIICPLGNNRFLALCPSCRCEVRQHRRWFLDPKNNRCTGCKSEFGVVRGKPGLYVLYDEEIDQNGQTIVIPKVIGQTGYRSRQNGLQMRLYKYLNDMRRGRGVFFKRVAVFYSLPNELERLQLEAWLHREYDAFLSNVLTPQKRQLAADLEARFDGWSAICPPPFAVIWAESIGTYSKPFDCVRLPMGDEKWDLAPNRRNRRR